MTHYELCVHAEGRRDAIHDKWRMAAWHAANTINPHIKTRITPAQLLGEQVSAADCKDLDEFRERTRAMHRKKRGA
jgi:hypothetical protein